MNEFFRFKYFIKYQWRAKTKYYLHSPFVYQFYLNVLEGANDANLEAIHTLRKKLASDSSVIEIKDSGTGQSATKTVSVIERNVAVRTKYGQLLYRLVTYFKPQTVIELGTSIGISSAYMALANERAKVTSLEGSAGLIEVAK